MSDVANSIQQILDTGSMASKWLNGGETETIDTAKGPVKTLAGINKGMTEAVLAATTATSNSNVVAGKGPKTFVIQPGKSFQRGQFVTAGSGEITLAGTVAAYAADTLVVAVDYVKGAGSAANWQIAMSGSPGTASDATPAGTRPFLVTKFPWE